MIKQVAHICIHTKDLDKTVDFYTNVLGLEKGFEFEKDGETFGYYIKFGNDTFIEIFKAPQDALDKCTETATNHISHVAIQVEDMDQLIADLRSKGLEIADKKLGRDHSWQVWITDPNGVRIEFHEYTPESMQLRGGKCCF